ncbi:hypothetical protein M231_05525 [Tremella mesenterica]|uniref:Uncharacterized protein n=1 Tax=Tremella mesenterica TaxID=5217 RepID=A0A4Q1BHX9_TREME|nr:hypothetical protein M231_05525 [Tremella mesenterica]
MKQAKREEIKLQAFLSSQFTEIVWIDTDNLPLADPNDLFDSVEYSISHAVFWSDLNKDHPDNAIWRFLARPCNDEDWPAETGQIVFDKRGNNGLNYAILLMSNHMMEDSEFYGNLMYGDKDTFRIGFYLLGLQYVKAPRVFSALGGYQIYGESTEENCGHTMMHYGLTPLSQSKNPSYHPKPAFAHMILTKHSSNFQLDKVFSHFSRPILDKSDEPTLIRCPARWTGPCFAWELQGPDGLKGTPNGFEDGQGTITLDVREAWRDENGRLRDQEIPEGLLAIQKAMVEINTS